MSTRLKRYADLVVRVGANVQPGQRLYVNGLVEHAEFARAVVVAGYEAGARSVTVNYVDAHVRRAMIEHADDEVLTETPEWLVMQARAIGNGGAYVMLAGDPEPELMAGLDPSRVGRARPTAFIDAISDAQAKRTVAWTIAAVPNEGWASQVFGEPDVERLWQAVETAVRLNEPDPVAAWQRHSGACATEAAGSTRSSWTHSSSTGPGPTSRSASCASTLVGRRTNHRRRRRARSQSSD